MNYFKGRDQIVDRVVIMREKMTGRSRGFGFVIATDLDTMESIVASPHVVDGKKIEAKKAIPKSEMNNPARKIFVGGVALNVDDDQFRAYFTQFGEVVESQIIRDRITRRSRGFGFVTFLKEGSVDRVLAQRHLIQGKEVEVKMAEPRKAQPQPVVRHVIQPVLVPAGYLPQLPQQTLRSFEDGGFAYVPTSLSPQIQYRGDEETILYPLRNGQGGSWSLPIPVHAEDGYWRGGAPGGYYEGGGDFVPIEGGHYVQQAPGNPARLQRKSHSESDIMAVPHRRPEGYGYPGYGRGRGRREERGGDAPLGSSPSDLDLDSLHISALEREYPEEFSPRTVSRMSAPPGRGPGKERDEFLYQRASKISPPVTAKNPGEGRGRRSSNEWNEIKSLFGNPTSYGEADEYRAYGYPEGQDSYGYAYSPDAEGEVYIDEGRPYRPRNGGGPPLSPAYVYEGSGW